jgi:hypothetical protein
MPHPRYAEIAARTKTPHCRGIRPSGSRCYIKGHDVGTLGDGFVHWRDRRATYTGIYRFLYLASLLRQNQSVEGGWRRLYLTLRAIPVLAAEAQVRVPRHYGDTDRARLRGMLLRVPTTDPVREEAMAWASR